MTSTGPESESGRVQAGADGYCEVTVVCGARRLDVALPATLPWADFQPSLLRLLFADQPPDGAARWLLTPVGRAALDPSATLSGAGVVPADVLVLGQSTGRAPRVTAVAPDVRDRLEDLVDGRDQFWERPASHRLALWAVTVLGAALLIPVLIAGAARGEPVAGLSTGLGLPAGFGLAALAATVAVLLGLTAALATRGAEMYCAATCLVVACGWAGVAGGVAFRGWMASWPGAGAAGLPTLVAIGTASALLIAGSSAAIHPPALVHTAALVTFGGMASAAAVAVRVGAPVAETCCLAALSANLVVGVVPRLALALGGVSLSEPDRNPAGPDRNPVELDDRMLRADRVLTGVVVGLSLAAVVCGLPAASSADGWHRLFAIGLGVALLLRSRVFSQVRHVLPLQVGGLLVLAELCVGLTVSDPGLLVPLILGPIVLLCVAAAGTAGPGRTPVTRARVGRALDLAEVALVVVMVMLAAGLLGGFGWVTTVVG